MNEEQQNEIEALEAIYFDSFQRISDSPVIFSITVKDGLILTATLPDEYPYEVPLIELTTDDEKMKAQVSMQAQENLGSVMIFNLITFLQEYIEIPPESQVKEKQERFGTKLTPELFMKWKVEFDKRHIKVVEEKGKLTGRGLFEKDKSMILSDTQFLKEDDVDVDITQFEKENFSEEEEKGLVFDDSD